jgi:hypothetical protein
MQPRNLLDAAAVLVPELEVVGAAADDDVELDGVLELGLDVLLPQAAISRLAAAAAAVVINAVCLTVSSTGPGCAGAQASRGTPHGPDCPQISSQ